MHVYGHVLPAMRDEAVRRLESRLWGTEPDAGMGRSPRQVVSIRPKNLKNLSRRGDSNP